MHLLLALAVCVGLFMLFPKGFKFMVGTWVGFTAGALAWCLTTFAFEQLFSPKVFLGFAVAGIIGGCVLAAKG
jgi:hypothetical protein